MSEYLKGYFSPEKHGASACSNAGRHQDRRENWEQTVGVAQCDPPGLEDPGPGLCAAPGPLRTAAVHQSLHTQGGAWVCVSVWVGACWGCGRDANGRPSRAQSTRGRLSASGRTAGTPAGAGAGRARPPRTADVSALAFTFWNVPLPSPSHPCPHCPGRYL